jgi:hypothetical protein
MNERSEPLEQYGRISTLRRCDYDDVVSQSQPAKGAFIEGLNIKAKCGRCQIFGVHANVVEVGYAVLSHKTDQDFLADEVDAKAELPALFGRHDNRRGV